VTCIRPFSALPVVLAAASAALLVALTGCSPDEPGTAAVIDGHKISVEELQDITRELQVMSGGQGGYVPESTVLALTIADPIVDRVVSEVGIETTDKQITTMLNQNADEERTYSQQTRNAIKAVVSLQKLAQPDAVGLTQEQASQTVQKIIDELKKTDVKINPRYGTFDPAQVTINPLESNWLEKVATPSPSSAEEQS
jgi:hypothetical protein